MSIFGLMVTRNEAGRYLECALTHLQAYVSATVVFDDGSTDDTMQVCRRFTPWVAARPADIAPFAVHEGRFRHAAWRHLEHTVRPERGDWVLSVDADEIVVANERSLADLTASADAPGATVEIPEVFSLDPLAVRTDRMWPGQRSLRLFQWRPDARFPYQDAEDKARARGPLPPLELRPGALGAAHGPICASSMAADPSVLQLLHLGYADPNDRSARHQRYAGRRGHNPQHVASILDSPRLENWSGPPVDVWRGVRAS